MSCLTKKARQCTGLHHSRGQAPEKSDTRFLTSRLTSLDLPPTISLLFGCQFHFHHGTIFIDFGSGGRALSLGRPEERAEYCTDSSVLEKGIPRCQFVPWQSPNLLNSVWDPPPEQT